jgi:hypothetical protein
LYYINFTPKKLNNERRNFHIVVSLTSFPPRFGTLHLCLKSLFNQALKLDVVVLVLSSKEINSESDLPESILNFKKYDLKILIVNDNLKPHNKYYYTINEYPNSIIITVDDDCYYDKTIVSSLYSSYCNYPNSVSARRIHKMTVNSGKIINSYNQWINEYNKSLKPRFDTIATGCGGVLYPPGILPIETFDIDNIKKLCLNADDIWLKFMEIKNNISVVWVKSNRIHAIGIENTQAVKLGAANVGESMNDYYINKLQNYYNINLASFCVNSLSS